MCRGEKEPFVVIAVSSPSNKEITMVYTDPKTGVTRDKYGNDIVRDPSGTDPHSHNSYWAWGIGLAVAAVLAFVLFSRGPSVERPASSTVPPATTESVPKAPSPTP
jgi:hypothetical protein